MTERRTVFGYFEDEETLRPQELVWGVLREPPAPKFGHQSVVTRTTVVLDVHVRSLDLGIVCVSPIDVVLDRDNALVVQPDVVFVSNERSEIVRDRIWGAPDLVAEVLSSSTAARDRTTKLMWYRQYGVRECWLLDPGRRTLTVVDFDAPGGRLRSFAGNEQICSAVLPRLGAETSEFFG